MRLPKLLLATSLFLLTQITYSQYYDTGEDPGSLKWMQIKTSRFTVIYPKSYGSAGIAFAQSLDEAYLKLGSLFPEKRFKLPVVIHNYTTQSNGYVSWAPRRMEIYPTPDQNNIPLDPDKQLAIHETTHVLQLESLNKGFTKTMSLILGEQTTGIVSALLPLWFFEGDAVFAESALTASGRGRIPSFQKQLKAIAVETGGMYKFDKIINGSYRDYIPDHYQSGYQMVTWALAKYDPQIWNKVLSYTGRRPYTLNPVNISLRRDAGLTKKSLYKETFDSLGTIWTNEIDADKAHPYETFNPDKKGKYINYYSPVAAGTDSIIAIKTSLSAPPSIVLIRPSLQAEKKIHIPGQLFPWQISYADNKLVWVENRPDPRWENRNYSIILMMDLKTRQVIRVSRNSRYLAASISPDGRKIAAVENTINNVNNLVLIDAGTLVVQQSIPAPENKYLQHPQWAQNGEKLTVIYLTEEGEGILSYKIKNQEWLTLVEAGRNDLQSTYLRNDSLFFISSISGTDNIYVKTPEGKIRDLTNSRFGTSDLFVSGNDIIFSDYTSAGNDICKASLSMPPKKANSNNSESSFLINRFDIAEQSNENIPAAKYIPEPYRKWQHLFKFHSWMPFYADIETIKSDPASIRPGITIMNQNTLSTLISSFGYEYSVNNSHLLHSRITWKGWYPVIESRLDYGDEPLIEKLGETIGNPSVVHPGVGFINAVSVPLKFSTGSFSQFFQPSVTSAYRNRYIYIKDRAAYDYGQTILSGRLYFSNYYKSAFRDIYPRIAQTFDLNYSFAPFDRNIYGSVLSLRTSFYLPGFLPNNGIKIRFEREKQVPSKFYFSSRISFPRGYKNINSQDLKFFSVDYVLPLVYPDFNISSLLYLKRIRTGLFYDYASGKNNTYYNTTTSGSASGSFHDYQENFRSFGFELLADFHLLRVPFMISGGVRSSWKQFNEAPLFELLFNIDLFGMTLGKRMM